MCIGETRLEDFLIGTPIRWSIFLAEDLCALNFLVGDSWEQ